MPGLLLHSPSDILRRVLIAQGYGTTPEDESTWPIHVQTEPDLPDNAITVQGGVGVNTGRTMPDSERQEHNGVQVRVRSASYTTGYAKAHALAIACDAMYQPVVTLDSSQYRIQAVTRTTDIIELGKEVPRSQRDVFVFNAILSVRKL